MRQAEVPRMESVLKGEGPVAGIPIGGQIFTRVEDAHAVVLLIVFALLADRSVKNEVWGVT